MTEVGSFFTFFFSLELEIKCCAWEKQIMDEEKNKKVKVKNDQKLKEERKVS